MGRAQRAGEGEKASKDPFAATFGSKRGLRANQEPPRVAIVSTKYWMGLYIDQERAIIRRWQTTEDLNWVLDRLSIPFRGVEVKGAPEKLKPKDKGLVVAYSPDWLAVWLKGEIIWQGPEDRLDFREVMSILKHVTSFGTVDAEANGLALGSCVLDSDLPEHLPRNLNYQTADA